MPETVSGACAKCGQSWMIVDPFGVPVEPHKIAFTHCDRCGRSLTDEEIISSISKLISKWPKLPSHEEGTDPTALAKEALAIWRKKRQGKETPAQTYLRVRGDWPKSGGADTITAEDLAKERGRQMGPGPRRGA